MEELFLIEIDVMSKLRHPNIVSFLGACLDTEDESLMLVTEHMAGGSLESALARARATVAQKQRRAWSLPRRQALSWSLQLAQALNYLHQCRPVLVHRDLCPAHLLLTASGQLKIAGFSYCAAPCDWLARSPSFDASSWLVPVDASYSAADLPDEARRQLALSHPYAAPEVVGTEGLGGDHWDERADVYSMSVIVWELVTGEAPSGSHPAAGTELGWPRWRGWEDLEELLRRGRAVDPESRCSSEEAVEMLEGQRADAAGDDAAGLCRGRCRMS
jgi:serine/threonine protein kinase